MDLQKIIVLFISVVVLKCNAQVTLYDDNNFGGRSFRISVLNRCVPLPNFNDRTSSIRTSGSCVVLYQDQCCQGALLRVTRDNAALASFNDRASSISPCGNYRAPFPVSIRETWLGHRQNLTKVAEDGDVAIYYNKDMRRGAVTNHRDTLKRVWQYVKQNYGPNFGPEGGRLIAVMHANSPYDFNSIQNYFDEASNCRNLIDLSDSSNSWSRPLAGIEFDVFLHEISHIVEGSSKGTHESPSYRFWNDSKWAEIFIYDVYSRLEYPQERDRVFRMWMAGSDDYPKANTYWFRDWFYPVWRDNGGVRVLNNYFEVLARHYPKEPGMPWKYRNGAALNIGEFVHFFSGAAGKNLINQARVAFKWNANDDRLLAQARRQYPGVQYPR